MLVGFSPFLYIPNNNFVFYSPYVRCSGIYSKGQVEYAYWLQSFMLVNVVMHRSTPLEPSPTGILQGTCCCFSWLWTHFFFYLAWFCYTPYTMAEFWSLLFKAPKSFKTHIQACFIISNKYMKRWWCCSWVVFAWITCSNDNTNFHKNWLFE